MTSARARALMALARAKANQSDPEQQDQQQDQAATEAAVLALLAAWFGSRAAIGAAQLPANLIAALVRLGLDKRAAEAVGEMVLRRPLTGRNRHGSPSPFEGMPASRRVAAEEPGMRARYVLSAVRRLTAAAAAGRYDAAAEDEERYLAAHVAAGRGRRAAARRVDEIARDNGPWLVWRTAGDYRVEARCRALEGRLFTPENPPDGYLPGAVHPRCRCYAEPWGRPLFALTHGRG